MNQEEIRMYELVVILRHSLGDPEIQQFIDDYTVRIEQSGSIVIKVDNWGKRKLAYEIKGERKGTYLCFNFQGKGAVIQPLENANRINDVILKSMIIRVEKIASDTVAGNEVEERESAVV
ncbi:MAG: 30S ribosomal protein S6 [Nitrospiraceae bacterium]|jgi:small subunit ribosomal protein S6|nr:30S ribosomal protein S6 [Nitrospiraceae bacterium]|tara:strand:- start:13240 stop:13599 length:360 start_codon:yes stop_codon:yes gene_type:complete